MSVLIEYFKELEEESIRDNFVIIYELLDEMMDFGYPQTTESKILQEYVRYPCTLTRPFTPESDTSHKNHTNSRSRFALRLLLQTLYHGGRRAFGTGRTRSSWMSSRASTSLCVQHAAAPRTASNRCPSQVNATGNVVRSEILGAVKMKCYLSGMPELRLGLNDKVMFETTGRSEYRPLHLEVAFRPCRALLAFGWTAYTHSCVDRF